MVDKKLYDLIIIGAGPAALSAAIYTTREDITTLLFEKAVPGGLIATTEVVDNYPGFPDGVGGIELSDFMRKQAERFGAVIEYGEVMSVTKKDNIFVLATTSGEFQAMSVLVATGSAYKKIGVPGEEEFYARGVHYCATCDGAFYRDKNLVCVGGGNSALQESIFLTRYAKHIDLLVRSDIRASDVLIHELAKHQDKISVHKFTTTDEIVGQDGHITKVIGTDIQSKKKVEFACDGVFVFVGLKPNSEFLKSTGVEFDAHGFLLTDINLHSTVPGLFVAGDVRSGATLQIATAVGEGATAALKIRQYLENS